MSVASLFITCRSNVTDNLLNSHGNTRCRTTESCMRGVGVWWGVGRGSMCHGLCRVVLDVQPKIVQNLVNKVYIQYDSAEWEPAFLRQAGEFLLFPLPPREASK